MFYQFLVTILNETNQKKQSDAGENKQQVLGGFLVRGCFQHISSRKTSISTDLIYEKSYFG